MAIAIFATACSSSSHSSAGIRIFDPVGRIHQEVRSTRSLPATVKNFLKPWFFINVHRGRVSGFYPASRFVD